MTFCIITHVHHSQSNGNYFGYAPYVNEMNIWIKNVDKVIIVAPLKDMDKSAIHQNYNHKNITFIAVPDFSLTSFKAVCKTFMYVPKILFSIYMAIKVSHHIHLRCPGNIGLLGCIIQIAFPKKKKSAKYAGNWDPKSKQPFSYRMQKWILSNTFLTKNMQVLVYGEWKNQSKNVAPFFTATYNENEKIDLLPRVLENTIQFIFVGSLTKGKQPLYAVRLIKKLKEKGYNVKLLLFGEGNESDTLNKYIKENKLEDIAVLQGNLNREELKGKYQNSHFLVLPSKSEGWPKVVAEAMFWGCVPVATKVSCISTMLDFGNRGVLLSENIDNDVMQLEEICNNQTEYNSKANLGMNWSRHYTLDLFESEITKIVQQ